MLLVQCSGSSTESTDHSHQNNLDDTCKRKLNPDENMPGEENTQNSKRGGHECNKHTENNQLTTSAVSTTPWRRRRGPISTQIGKRAARIAKKLKENICNTLKSICGVGPVQSRVDTDYIKDHAGTRKISRSLQLLLKIKNLTKLSTIPFKMGGGDCQSTCRLELDVTFLDIKRRKKYNFMASSHSIQMPGDIFNYTDDKVKSIQVVSMLFQTIPEMVENYSKRNITLYDNFISTTLNSPLLKPLSEEDMIKIVCKKPKNKIWKNLKHECVYWKGSYSTGEWSTEGCNVDSGSNKTHTVCVCNHLTDFSVLMRVTDIPHDMVLHWISFIGCGISIFFLLLTCAIIIRIRKLRVQERYKIHLNLSIALIIGNLILLTTDVARENKRVCFGVSILLHYFYLSAFCWMLCEAVFIWRGLILVFDETEKLRAYLLFAWGVPAAIVCITIALLRYKMTSYTTCWLSLQENAVWAFLTPALLIILINIIILLRSLLIMRKQVKKSRVNSLRATAKFILFLVPLFGATWIFGVFSLSRKTAVFQYVFVTLNSLQGFFIFTFYICCSKQVRIALVKQFFPVKSERKLTSTSISSKKRLQSNNIALCVRATMMNK